MPTQTRGRELWQRDADDAVAGIVAREAARAAERDTVRQRQQSSRQVEANAQRVPKANKKAAQMLARQQKAARTAEECATRLQLAQALLEAQQQ